MSGTGIHCIATGGPLLSKRHGELWDAGHWLAVTGQHYAGTPTTVEHRPDELLALATVLAPSDYLSSGGNYEPPDRIALGERHRELFRLVRHLKGNDATREFA